MRVSKSKSKHSKSNSLHTTNQYRKRIAGKPGSKHYLDPNKVFIGNLPYDATEQDISTFLQSHLGTLHNIESIKIISDWKTGKSKGYGFISFMEPMCATSAIASIKNKKLMGRVVRLDQGQKKDEDKKRVLFVKKRLRLDATEDEEEVDEEGQVIGAALDQVESNQEEEYELSDFDEVNDDIFNEDDDDDDDDDDEDDEFDGWFEEIYGKSKYEDLDEEEAKNMNRDQRREAARRRPKKKLPHKGFG